ncbi:MAG TPA: response regulator [Candidatus Sulfopaludibacter sp.]|jgi:hypothetical protein|nr:response regulator [Candidatus Sulfopaludibacter sp.]
MEMQGVETILVVEDQPDVLQLATETLESYGYKVLGAGAGPEALEVAARYQGPIHLLLTDVVMPGMDGKLLAQQMRLLRPGVKTVYMSGYVHDLIRQEDLLGPDVGYLPKPFGPEELAAKVREVLGTRQARRPKTILVVDDEDSIRGLFHELLTAEGYHVTVASDGRQACDMLRRGIELDLVITDLVMPNQEGIETIQAIKHQFPKVKIIAMSGAFGGQFLNTAKLLGADATLLKPVHPDRLCSAVAAVLGGSEYAVS